MNRHMEFGMLVCIAALTTVSVATVIHDANAGHRSALDRDVANAWTNLTGWVHPHLAAPPVHASAATPVNHSLPSKQGAVSSGGDVANESSLSSAEVSRLKSIGDELVHSMSQSDWSALFHDVMFENTNQATQDIEQLLASHLSPGDVTWLKLHFHGQQAFGPEDVQLAQNTITQVVKDLTPAEHSLLDHELSEYGFTL